MTAKEFLKQYTEANDNINDRLEEVARLRAQAVSVNGAPNPNRVQSSGDNDPLASIVAKIVDMEREVDQEVDRLREIKRQVMTAIMGVADHKQRRVLYRKYILGETWLEIEKVMKYEERWLRRLHRRGLEQIDPGKPTLKSVIV